MFPQGGRPALLVIAMALIAVPPSARGAQEEGAGEEQVSPERRDEAKRYFLEGSEHFAAGDFRRAISLFRRAFDIVKSPAIIYNVARCHEELEETDDAIYHYRMYLRLYPDAADAPKVEDRIEQLEGGEAAPQEDGAKDAAEEDAGERKQAWPPGLRLGAGIGASIPLAGEWAEISVPVQLLGHIPLLEWLYLSVAFDYSEHVFATKKLMPGDATSHVGLFAGVSGFWPVAEIIALTARLGAQPSWVSRERHDGVVWLDLVVGGGVLVEVHEAWRVTFDLLFEAGPVFNPTPAVSDPWQDPATPFALGALVGVEYALD